MRINGLDVRAYGPFTDWRKDLTEGRGKLELIYGPNEAGKSSLLRTISHFLFGIPVQTDDDFLHNKKSLLIGATIEHEGKSLTAMRRKGSGNTLLASDEKTPLAEQEFRAVVPLDDERAFTTMFGLNSQRLTDGGEELMSGKGDFGRLLFSAASGIEGFRGILASLSADADALLKVKGGAIVECLKEFEKQRKNLSTSMLKSSVLDDMTARREQAETKKERLGIEHREKNMVERRLERIREALQLIARKQQLLASLDSLKLVQVARDGFAVEFSKAEAEFRSKLEDRQRIVQEIGTLEKDLSGLTFSEALLLREAEIAKLPELLGATGKAAKDKAKLQERVRVAESNAGEFFSELGMTAAMESIPSLQVTAENRRRTEELDVTFTRLNADAKNAAREVAKMRADIEAGVNRLAELPAAKPVDSIQLALAATDQFAAAATTFAARREKALREAKRLDADLRALPWAGSLDALRQADLPSPALVERWKQRFEGAENALRKARENSAEAEVEVRQIEAGIRQKLAGRTVPTLEAMEDARNLRDQGWRAVRSAWLDGDASAAREFLPGYDSALALAEAYEAGVKAADISSDDLREHANEAANLAQAKASLETARIRRDGYAEELKNAVAEMDGLQPQWAALWTRWGLEPQPPAQMTDWLNRRSRLLERASAWTEENDRIGDFDLQSAAAADSLRQTLALTAGAPDAQTLTELRTVAKNWIEVQVSNKASLVKWEESVAAARRNLEVARQREMEVNADLTEWKQHWSQLLEGLRMGAAMDPAAVRAALELRRNLAESYKDWAESRRRIAGIEEEAAHFQQIVETLTREVAPDLLPLPPASAAGLLHKRLSEHVLNRDLRKEKEKALNKQLFDLQARDEDLATIGALRNALAAEAGCLAVEQIPVYIKQSTDKAKLLDDLAAAEAQLARVAGTESVEDFEAEALRHSEDALPGEIAQLQAEVEQIIQQREETITELATLAKELADYEKSTATADAAANLEFERAKLLEQTGRYLRLKLAEHVLKSAVERHRKKTSGDMLRRSSEIFSRLTLGAFDELDLDCDEKNNPKIVGVRKGRSARLSTKEMSSGTCDQLYLALRVASLEIYFQNHSPIPFIADDILVHFDDARAAAALQVLAGLAQQTQVLLFTHHQHLLDVAAGAVPSSKLAVYRI